MLRLALCTALIVVTLSSSVRAQAPALTPGVTPAPTPGPTLAPTPPSTPAPTPTPEAPAVPPPTGVAEIAQVVLDMFRIYGILKPAVSFSSAAVESFSNPNASAITAAANPVLANLPDDSRLTFQAAQTRFGIWVNEKGSVRGHLEFDFYDSAKASPTVQALLRLRIATVEWAPVQPLWIVVGQDWDLHAPINPFGVNLVGANFQAGNTAFMRHQVRAQYRLSDTLELAGAIGLQGSNATAKDAALELARIPTFAVRVTGLLGKYGKVGVSGIATRLRFSPGPTERHAFAGAGALFGELSPYSTLTVRFEGYVGQDLANLGTLALTSGTAANDVAEFGAFISARQIFLERHGVYATYGHARALDGDDVASSYSYPTTMGPLPAFSTATLAAANGAGIRWNNAARVGYEFKPLKGLVLALEGYWYRTRHNLLAIDVARVDSSTRRAFGSELAMLYTF